MRSWWYFLLATILLISCRNRESDILRIAAASNVKGTVEELAKAFHSTTGIRTEVVSGSSGKLTAQILQGAPYDIFVSADMSYPEEIYKEDFAVSAPVAYATGALILWSTTRSTLTLSDLSNGSLNRIALPNPELAPYGKAAKSVLERLSSYSAESLIMGENVNQTSHFILSGVVDAGFTAKSVVTSTEFASTGVWIDIPDSLYEPIIQGMVVLKDRPNLAEAMKFQEFILSVEGRTILIADGYSLP